MNHATSTQAIAIPSTYVDVGNPRLSGGDTEEADDHIGVSGSPIPSQHEGRRGTTLESPQSDTDMRESSVVETVRGRRFPVENETLNNLCRVLEEPMLQVPEW